VCHCLVGKQRSVIVGIVFSGSYNHSIVSAIQLSVRIDDDNDTFVASVSLNICEDDFGAIECFPYLEMDQQSLSKLNCTSSRRRRSVENVVNLEKRRRHKRY